MSTSGSETPSLGSQHAAHPPLPLGHPSPTPPRRLRVQPGTARQGSTSISTTTAHRALAVWTQRHHSPCCHLTGFTRLPFTPAQPPTATSHIFPKHQNKLIHWDIRQRFLHRGGRGTEAASESSIMWCSSYYLVIR